MDNGKILKVKHFGETEADNRMVTFSPSRIVMMSAPETNETVQGRSVKRVTVLMDDGGNVEIMVSEMDQHMLETVVGTYTINEY